MDCAEVACLLSATTSGKDEDLVPSAFLQADSCILLAATSSNEESPRSSTSSGLQVAPVQEDSECLHPKRARGNHIMVHGGMTLL